MYTNTQQASLIFVTHLIQIYLRSHIIFWFFWLLSSIPLFCLFRDGNNEVDQSAMDMDSIDADADNISIASYSPRTLLSVLPSSSASTVHHHPQMQSL